MQEKNGKRKIGEYTRAARFLLRFAVLAAVILVAVLVLGCSTASAETQAGKGNKTETTAIVGITAEPIVAEYNGAEHSLIIEGTEDGDKISYSTDGTVWSEVAPSFTAPGVYTVYFKVEREGFKSHLGSSSVTITRTEIKDISAENVTGIYDGQQHGIKINGIADGDKVTYGDGEVIEPLFTEVGEYDVRFSVERGDAEYSGSAKLTILPDLSGLYVTREAIVRINKEKAVIDGQTFDLVYGVTGEGNIGKQPFSVKNGVLRYNGKNYTLAADKRVYKLIVGTETAYVMGGGELIISAEFEDGATVKADGETIFEVSGVNYCESVAGAVPKIKDNRAEHSVTATEEITEAEIVLSRRQTLVVPEKTQFVIFDGQPHEPATEYGSPTKGSPQTAVGEYEFEYYVLRDGYLPTVAKIKMIIVPDISGVYYDGKGFIEIKYDEANVNGVTAQFAPRADGWIIGERKYAIKSDSLTDEKGRSYTKCKTEKVIALCSGGEIAVFADFGGGDYALGYESGQAILWVIDDSGKQEKARINSDGNTFILSDGRALFVTRDGFFILTGYETQSGLTVINCTLSENRSQAA